MAIKTEIVNGRLKITETPNEIIRFMTREEVVDRIDHLNINLAEVQIELDKWNNYLQKLRSGGASSELK